MRDIPEGATYVPAWDEANNSGFIGGLYVRPFGPFPRGYIHEGHAHYIDHAMFVEAGAVKVTWTNSAEGTAGVAVIEAPAFVPVKAEAEHQNEVLEDGTRWRCIFAEAEAEKLGDADGPVPFNMEKA